MEDSDVLCGASLVCSKTGKSEALPACILANIVQNIHSLLYFWVFSVEPSLIKKPLVVPPAMLLILIVEIGLYCVCSVIFLDSFSSVETMSLFNLGPVPLLWLQPTRLDAVLRTLNFLKVSAAIYQRNVSPPGNGLVHTHCAQNNAIIIFGCLHDWKIQHE